MLSDHEHLIFNLEDPETVLLAFWDYSANQEILILHLNKI